MWPITVYCRHPLNSNSHQCYESLRIYQLSVLSPSLALIYWVRVIKKLVYPITLLMEIHIFNPFGLENQLFSPFGLENSLFQPVWRQKIRFFSPFGLENQLFQPVCPRKSAFSARLSPIHHTALIY